MVYMQMDMPNSCDECPLYREEGCIINSKAAGYNEETGRMFGCPLRVEHTSIRYAFDKAWEAATYIHCMSDEELEKCFNAESPMEVYERYRDDPMKAVSIVLEYLNAKK